MWKTDKLALSEAYQLDCEIILKLLDDSYKDTSLALLPIFAAHSEEKGNIYSSEW